MSLAPLLLVRQHLPSHALSDIGAEVRRQLDASGFDAGLKPGARVAIACGSRGIANIELIVKEAVAWWKARGFAPFLVPAMGSHGAASARGQAEVLAKYGLTEERVGCPVRSSLAVVELGRTDEGIDVVIDREAWRAAAVMLCGRVKWHTDFAGRLESGLFKMMAIGLGKPAGAAHYHAHGHRIGLEAVIRAVGRRVLASGRVVGGLAILEDGYHATARVEAVPAAVMERREEELLELVKTWMPRIPVAALDVLILNEIGKNWSGSGMDPKIVNRDIHGAYNPWPFAPRIGRILLRDLHPLSYGNSIGMGMADVVHNRVLKKMKRRATYVNGFTSGALASLRTPAHFATDRECLERLVSTTGRLSPSEVSVGWIRNSQDLTLIALSAQLRSGLEGREGIEILGEPRALEFDRRGDLVNWLAV